MTLVPSSPAELAALLSASYPRSGEKSGLLGAIARRENGGRANISPGGQSARLVSISAGNDPNPYVVTVCLYKRNLTPVPVWNPALPAALPSNALPRARIAWGAGKTAQEITIDFLHGTRLTLDCSSLTIDCDYDNFTTTRLSPGSPPTGPQMEFSASVVYGSLGSRLTTFTDGLFSIVATRLNPGPVEVPRFAEELKIVSTGAGAVFNVFFGSSPLDPAAPLGAGLPRLFSISQTSVAPNTWIQIPNGTEYVDLIQTAGIAGNVMLQYRLNV